MPTKTTRDTRATNKKTRSKRCASSKASSCPNSGKTSMSEKFLRSSATNSYQRMSSYCILATRRDAATLRPKIWMVKRILRWKVPKKMSITISKVHKIYKRLMEKSFVKNPTIQFISLKVRLVFLITKRKFHWVQTTSFYVVAAWEILISFTEFVFSRDMIANLCRIVQMPGINSQLSRLWQIKPFFWFWQLKLLWVLLDHLWGLHGHIGILRHFWIERSAMSIKSHPGAT